MITAEQHRFNFAVATSLRAEREAQGRKQKAVAAQIGMHVTKLSRIESGDLRVSVADLVSLCKEYGIQPGVLLADAKEFAERGTTP